MILPREHGAWGLVLQPYVVAVVLGGRWNAMVAVGLAAVLGAFLIREPLLVLARQRWLWRERRPESAEARRMLLWLVPLVAGCGLLLGRGVGWRAVVSLGAVAAGMTVFWVTMAVRNWQRSALLQASGSVLLGLAAFLGALVTAGSIQGWTWWLWVLASQHAVGAILLVHARLDLKARNRATLRLAWRFHWVSLAFGASVAAGAGWVAVPVFFSVGVNLIEARRLQRPEALAERLRNVGLRMLAISLVHAAVTGATLWRWAQ